MVSEPTIHIVDDDGAIRDALSWLFRSRGLKATAWDSGEAFLGALGPEPQGCVILDVRMEGMTGIEVFERLLDQRCPLPVIFLTGHGDVPLAVTALKRGAFDFVEKPFNDNQLVDRVVEALRSGEDRRRALQAEATRTALLAALTAREREVMDHVLAGEPNKAIADALGVSVRTVEVHRARVFEKMGVGSAVELASLLQPRR
jgi:two-component system response regulator DctR